MKELFVFLQNFMYEPERIYTAMAAIFLVCIVGIFTGPMHGNANPFLWKLVNRGVGMLGSRLNRPQRAVADRAFRGFVLLVIVVFLMFLLGNSLGQLAAQYPLKGLTSVIFLSLALTGGTVWFSLLKLYFAQRDNRVSRGAFYAIAQSTRTDLTNLDNFGITRVGMGLAVRSFDKGAAGPVFWFLIAGLPGAYIYAGLAALAWRFGQDGNEKAFGSIILALEKLMGFVPSMLAGALVAMAGLFTPTGGMTRAIAALGHGKGRAPYEQGGWPVTALAFSLNVSLGGPSVDLDGLSIRRDWVGPENATAQLENGHLRRALYMSLISYMLLLAALMGALFWAGKLF